MSKYSEILAKPEEFRIADAVVPSRRYEKEIYPRVDDQAAMTEIYKTYMSGADLEEAAKTHGVEWRTVKYWALKGGWVAERTAQDAVAIAESSRKLAQLRAERVNDIVDRTVRVQEKVTLRAEKMLDDDVGNKLKPSELKSISESAKNASDNSLRAVGIGESGATAAEQEASEKKEGRRPLVMVFQNGGLPQARRPDTVVETETL